MKAAFQIVTTTGTTYTQGADHDTFKGLGRDKATLKSYEHTADYVILHFSNNLSLEIPEGRVEHIALTGKAGS